jgi:hypothetical protein
MWFTTVVAVACASFACARRLWGESGVLAWLGLVFLFWPSIAGLVAWSCPEILFKTRVRTYALIGTGVVLAAWSRAWPPYPALLGAFVATLLTALIVWAPQGLAVFSVMTYARERGRTSKSNDGDARAGAGEVELKKLST